MTEQYIHRRKSLRFLSSLTTLKGVIIFADLYEVRSIPRDCPFLIKNQVCREYNQLLSCVGVYACVTYRQEHVSTTTLKKGWCRNATPNFIHTFSLSFFKRASVNETWKKYARFLFLYLFFFFITFIIFLPLVFN